MADDDVLADPPISDIPLPPQDEEELTPQEKLKRELLQLPNKQLTPAEIADIAASSTPANKKLTPAEIANIVKSSSKMVKTERILPPGKPPEADTTLSEDAPDLQQPDYSVKPDVKIKELSDKALPGKTFSPAVERSINMVAKMYGIDPIMLRGFAAIESGGDPNSNMNKPTQYKGLFQVGTRDTAKGPSEWTKYGGGKSPYDPEANTEATAKIMVRNRQWFNKLFGRDPKPEEYYLMHQQGPGFFSQGTMTNISGNLPAHARTAENMSWEGFKAWWTDRVRRAMAERGAAPDIRRLAETNLDADFLSPVMSKALHPGGLVDTPEGQKMLASLMNPVPLAQQTTPNLTMDDNREHIRMVGQRGVGTSRVGQQVQGKIPGSVDEETTLPIPGIEIPTAPNTDAPNPALSTMMSYSPLEPPPPVEDVINKPVGEPTFIEKLGSIMKTLSPVYWSADSLKTVGNLADAFVRNDETGKWGTSPLVEMLEGQGEGYKNVAQGLASGVQDLPIAMAGGVAVPAAALTGVLTGADPLKKWAVETSHEMQEYKHGRQRSVGIDPENVTSGQYVGHQIGSNLGLGLIKTGFNVAMANIAERYLGPGAEYMGKNYPIPNINPFQATTAHAAPLIVNTPGGPVEMNEADVQQFAWGGIFAIGFGSSIPLAAKTVRVIRTAKPLGLDGIFDPRRPVTGAPGTEAASLPVDMLKAGSLDPGKALGDIAERHAKYTQATRHGIDPIASNEVLQHWRVQTNSGAQALIGTALREGEMNVPEYRFNVNTSVGKLAEFAKEKPDFHEYLRLRVINDEIQLGLATNKALPVGKPPTAKVEFNDARSGVLFDEAGTARAIAQLEAANPEFRQAYVHYRDNLVATRDLISSHATNAIEDYTKLTDHAIKRPSMPIFSAKKNTEALLNRYLSGKASPLEILEQEMTRTFEKQMRFDAEKRYIDMTKKYVGDKAFTPRDANWVEKYGSAVKEDGALLVRKNNGETTYWTADPLIVSIFNSGHVPLSGWEQSFAIAKNVFQKTTTGFWAPWFAPTGMIRSMEQGWTTAPGGVKTAGGRTVLPAGPGSTAMGLITRTGAQMARPTAKFFRETLANTAWGKTLTLGQADLMARSFEKWYMDSYYRRMEVAGAFNKNPVMEGNEVAASVTAARNIYGTNPHMNPVINFMEKATDTFLKFTYDPLKKGVYTPINALLTAVQEAPAYGYTRKALKGSDSTKRPTWNKREVSDAEAVQAFFKNYTGDPSIRGYHKDKSGKPLRFQTEGKSPRPLNAVQQGIQNTMRATWGLQNAGIGVLNQAAHGARSATPWAGVLFQSPSATLAAMRDNPVRANLAFAASAVLPEVTAYLWNAHWSTIPVPVMDENGQPVLDAEGNHEHIKYDYVNHSVNGRNSHQSFNNVYFAVPGQPPQGGVEFRHYQETSLNRYMTRMMMHQYMGKSYNHVGDDLKTALAGFLGTAVIPPMPSPVGAFLANKGMISTGGWMGTLYKSRYNPYVDLGGGESTTELMFRAIIPSITDITLQAMQAGMHAPDWGSVPGAVTSQVGKRILSRTAIIGDVTRDARSATGSTVLSDELWSNKKVIDDLTYRYRVHDEGQGGIKINKGSKAGRAFIADFMGELPPTAEKDLIANPGLPQKEPKNQLYKMLMSEIERTFQKDEPKKGGIGFKAMWGLYGVYGQLVSRMRTVDDGNAGAWVAKQMKDPETMRWLRERNVNPLDYRQVREYYQSRRNRTTEKILQTIKATEQRISKMPEIQTLLKGKPFKVNMLDPDELGLNIDPADRVANEE